LKTVGHNVVYCGVGGIFTHGKLRCGCLYCGPQYANRIQTENFIKEYHAKPSKMHEIIEELR
jgi:hypothetical protein